MTPAQMRQLDALKRQVATLTLKMEVDALSDADRRRDPERAKLDATLARLKVQVARLACRVAEDELAAVPCRSGSRG